MRRDISDDLNPDTRERLFRDRLIIALWGWGQLQGFLVPNEVGARSRHQRYLDLNYQLLVQDLLYLSDMLPTPELISPKEVLIVKVRAVLDRCRSTEIREADPNDFVNLLRNAVSSLVRSP